MRHRLTQVNAPCFNPSQAAGTLLTYPRRVKSEVDLDTEAAYPSLLHKQSPIHVVTETSVE